MESSAESQRSRLSAAPREGQRVTPLELLARHSYSYLHRPMAYLLGRVAAIELRHPTVAEA